MTKKNIIVNRHHIDHNKKYGTNKPVLSVQRSGKSVTYGHTVDIEGPSRVIYCPDQPLKCGVTVWIEAHGMVTVREFGSDSEGDKITIFRE